MRVTEAPGPDSLGTLPVTIDAAFGNGRLPSFRGGHWHAHACARPARGKPRRAGRALRLRQSAAPRHTGRNLNLSVKESARGSAPSVCARHCQWQSSTEAAHKRAPAAAALLAALP
jgi:hypothetical protein